MRSKEGIDMSDSEVRSGISVFLSYPKPCRRNQQDFVDRVGKHLQTRGFTPRTLGVTEYDMDAPLKAIRRLMLESNGLITIAFGRTHVAEGAGNFRSDMGIEERPLRDAWFTSPWAHIEPAMAYQIGLPVLIFRESHVIADGILEHGVLGTYMPEVDLDGDLDAYFGGVAWSHVIAQWEGYVRAVVEAKGNPPRLF
jgi:hypothetical protein